MSSVAVDVALGLFFAFFVFSLLASGVQESIANVLELRGRSLRTGIQQLLQGKVGRKELAGVVLDHPLIKNLRESRTGVGRWLSRSRLVRNLRIKPEGEYRLPSYIPAQAFSAALIETLGTRGGLKLDGLPDSTRESLEAIVDRAKARGEDLAEGIEKWFDGQMDRVSGWYKRKAKWISLSTGIVVAVLLNVDAVRLARDLYSNDALREAVSAQALDIAFEQERAGTDGRDLAENEQALPAGEDGRAAACEDDEDGISCAKRLLEDSQLPIRLPLWKDFVWTRIFGWLFTAGAISLGAPFWFDLIGRVAPLRKTGPKPETTAD